MPLAHLADGGILAASLSWLYPRTTPARGCPSNEIGNLEPPYNLAKEPITMERKTAKEFPQELLDIFHLYQHGEIDRREFFNRAQKFAVGGVTVMALWESLKPNYAWAQQVPETDAAIKVEDRKSTRLNSSH